MGPNQNQDQTHNPNQKTKATPKAKSAPTRKSRFIAVVLPTSAQYYAAPTEVEDGARSRKYVLAFYLSYSYVANAWIHNRRPTCPAKNRNRLELVK